MKEPRGTRGTDEQEGVLVEKSGLSRTWKGSGGADRQERRHPSPSEKQKLYCYKFYTSGPVWTLSQQLSGVVFVKSQLNHHKMFGAQF